MRFTTGTLVDLVSALNQMIDELGAPIAHATGTLANATPQLNALMVWRVSPLSPASGSLASVVAKYNQIALEVGVRTRFTRIKWAKPPIVGSTNQVTIIANGKTHTLTGTQLAALNTQAKVRAAIQVTFGAMPDVWLHLNRNGRWCFATGATPPAVWPEDEVA